MVTDKLGLTAWNSWGAISMRWAKAEALTEQTRMAIKLKIEKFIGASRIASMTEGDGSVEIHRSA